MLERCFVSCYCTYKPGSLLVPSQPFPSQSGKGTAKTVSLLATVCTEERLLSLQDVHLCTFHQAESFILDQALQHRCREVTLQAT